VLVDGVLDPTAGVEEPPATRIATDTVSFHPVEAAALALEALDPTATEAQVRVVDAVGGLQTGRMEAAVPVEDGRLVPDPDEDLLGLAVVERHGGDGGIGAGFVHGLGMERGAVGSTVAHDAHNLVVAGADHASMARVANHLREVGGGIAAYDPDEDEMTSLVLPVAGLLSDRPLVEVHDGFEAVEGAARAIGMSHEGGIMELSFLSLEVIPEYRLTNNGLVDVEAFDYVDVVIG
jgi:adenine deaminase